MGSLKNMLLHILVDIAKLFKAYTDTVVIYLLAISQSFFHIFYLLKL